MDTEAICWRIFLRLCQRGKGRGLWHNRRFPPSFEVRSGVTEVEFAYRGQHMVCRRAETMQDRFSGRGHILLSGPSVREIREPRRLKDAFLIGVNGSPTLFDECGTSVDLYVVDDTAFVQRKLGLFLHCASRAKHTLLNYALVAELMAHGVTLPNAVVVDSVSAPFRRSRPEPGSGPVFSRQFSHGLRTYGTVAGVALQAAYCLGLRDVRLFGLDLSREGRFYHEADPEPQRLHLQFEETVLRPLEYAGQMMRRGEWTVWNCSPGSLLPESVLPKVEPNAGLRPDPYAAAGEAEAVPAMPAPRARAASPVPAPLPALVPRAP
jgi:hypothetical protein